MSSDHSKSSPAWVPLYDALWQTGQRIALAMLRGSPHERDREDIVATAIAQTVMGFLEKKSNRLQCTAIARRFGGHNEDDCPSQAAGSPPPEFATHARALR